MTLNDLDFYTLICQLASMKEEVEEHKKRIESLKNEIERMESGHFKVTDSVTCGKKGKKPLQIIKITGFPGTYYDQRVSLLNKRIRNLADKEQEFLEVITAAEERIENIKDSRMRRILTMRYIDGLSWVQVAHRLGGNATADSCRMACDRFLEKN